MSAERPYESLLSYAERRHHNALDQLHDNNHGSVDENKDLAEDDFDTSAEEDIDEVKQTLQNTEQQLQATEASYDRLQGEHTGLGAKYPALTKIKDSRRAAIAFLDDLKTSPAEACTELESTKAGTVADTAQSEKDSDKLNQENANLQERYENEQNQVLRLQHQLNSMNDDLSLAQKHLAARDEEITALCQQMSASEESLAGWPKRLHKVQQEANKYLEQLETQEERFADHRCGFEQREADLRQRLEEQGDELGDANAAIADYHDQVMSLQNSTIKLTDELQAASADLAAQSLQRDSIRHTFEAAEVKLTGDLTKAEETIRHLERRTINLSHRLTSSQAETDDLTHRLAATSARLAALSLDKDQLDEELVATKTKAVDQERIDNVVISGLSKALGRAQETVAQMEQCNGDLSSRLERLQVSHDDLAGRVETTTDQLGAMTTEKTCIEEQLEVTKAELTSHKRAHDETLARLSGDLARIQSSIPGVAGRRSPGALECLAG
ncbi:hypothetical protein CLAFUW4_10753 [Fulvia fulva]|uniref:Uncharacterized protein n=1 Tax=Passalora fulva TaxID=5499 RepID=A0A9Q8LHT9_PASFU|nr:uncharacterized protein CLAFUR5_05366 [Fulvia fulva]KAK4615439.1 hypothetical protein CLAFUR4_10758 [Fulvia fulva]KAK4617102.1 hypothetical protein CLAFUR0_10765 [Fulvia fulva]UJO16883.1 hypothetical protein CLAFUR5_05366 [Fulvia fulva]WPV19218.1 hypothetical protein CLAFUW4_10753 [Fulvia fulva]WPV34259.1 hypothetical protein CLAFUW7_10755 [Fulvia fulva]